MAGLQVDTTLSCSTGFVSEVPGTMLIATNHLCSAAAEGGNTQRKIISEILVTYYKMALCPLYQKTCLSLDGSVVLNSFSTCGHNSL